MTYLEELKFKYSLEDVESWINKCSTLKVLVVGDTIIDKYTYVSPLGISPKDNIVNVKFESSEAYSGGVLAVARHLSNFCKEVHIVTSSGANYKNRCYIMTDNSSTRRFDKPGPTTVKERFIEPDSLNKLFEVTQIDYSPLPRDLKTRICNYLEGIVSRYDLTIVTDFGHGFLYGNEIPWLLSEKSKFLALNVQTNSANVGYNLITRYPLADYVSLDELEIRLALQDRFGRMEELMNSISKVLSLKYLSITQGKHGSLVLHKKALYKTPAFSKEVRDKVGAGDAYLSITSLLAAVETPPDLLGFIGNVVGALKVSTIGNKESVTKEELLKLTEELLNG